MAYPSSRKLFTLKFSFHIGGFRLNSLFPPPLTTPGIPMPILPWEYSTCYVASFIRRELSNRSIAVLPTSSAFPPRAPLLRYMRQDSRRAQNSRRDFGYCCVNSSKLGIVNPNSLYRSLKGGIVTRKTITFRFLLRLFGPTFPELIPEK